MIITNVRTRHILVFHAGNALTNFFALYTSHITQHTCSTKVLFRQIIGRQGRCMISRQSDQVMENTGITGLISLEALDTLVCFQCQLCTVVIRAHQFGSVVS